MPAIQIILVILDVIVCLLLIGVILLQRNDGSGMGAAFGGSGDAIFGAQMGNVLTKATVVLGTLFLAITLILSYSMSHKGTVRRRAPAPQPVREAIPVPQEAAPIASDVLDLAEEGGLPAAAPAAAPAADVPAPEAPAAEE
ncbi:MAG: preprotein translocase subunit SecG [Kiritimatiellia bacterium]|jgi:preprotein translocase subunit SecG